MPRPGWVAFRGPTKALVTAMTVSLLATLLVVGTPTTAFAAGTSLFNNTFHNNTVDGTGTVTVPVPSSGTNDACLTAKSNSTSPPLLSCAGAVDNQGSGKLQLTPATANQVGGVFGQNSFPTSNGLDITFNSYQWGGTGADGIGFTLSAVDPTNPVPPTTMGPSAGSLGYGPSGAVAGLTNAYLGVGLDVAGNFSSNTASGSGCTPPATITTQTSGAVVVRGPGSGLVGYCGLTTTYDGTLPSKVVLRASTRTASVVPVHVLINPTASSFTSSGVVVAAGTYKMVVTPVGGAARTLAGTLPAVGTGLYPSTAWLSSNGVPKQLMFGLVGSTSATTDVHEISDLTVTTFTTVPQLAVTTTSYAPATSQLGGPVNYDVAASVLSGGANETTPISVTQTVPTGVVPLGAYGTGWVCQAPAGRSVTCTTSGSSFNHGTDLPDITVVAIVTGSGVTSTVVQTASTTRASSADASSGTATSTTVGTVPAAPSGIVLVPTIGPIAGGGSLTTTGSTGVAPTAVEIGTTAEGQAGTPVTLFPCPGSPAPGCFAIVGNSAVISSMPARPSAGTVNVTWVTLGVAGSAAYVYADKPAAPATPTATAGISSATLTWAAPANNGSAITGYVVTPYLAGVAQTAVSFDASTTTRTLTGLTAASSYTFTVAAVNAYGTSTVSAQSVAVTPYTLPGAPAITAVAAGDNSATLTWTAPSNGGSAISAYVVTPFIGAVVQAAQTFNGASTTATATGLTAGTAYTFTVTAQNLAGTGPASAHSLAVTPNVSPSLIFTAPPAGEVGAAYSRQLTVTNGSSPFVWSISSGAQPAGMTLNASTGLLSGAPTASGTFNFTVQVVDGSGQTATKAVILSIAPAEALSFSPLNGEVGVAYSQQPTLTGGTGPFTWAISAGSVPTGLTLNTSTGLLSGTPTAAGTFSMTVSATDSFNQVATKTVGVTIAAQPAFAAAASPAGQVGVAYSASLSVTGGTTPFTWSIVAGSLPAGLTLNTATGVVSGTPTTVGSSPFTASVIDANSQTATKAVTLVITAGPIVIVKTANVSSAAAGSTVGYTITVTNTGPTLWTGATVSDPLTGVVDDAVYNANATATAGTVTYASSTLGWTGNVAANGSVTISYSVTVNNPDAGNKVLSNTVTSTTSGANCSPAGASSDARCSATVTVPGLTIVKSADGATTSPGSTVHFTIVVTNTGQSAYPAATLTDSLAGVLDDAHYNADGTATSGSVTFTSPSLAWTGTLAVGASATITYSATVANPDTGDRSLTGTIVSPSAGSPCPSVNPAPQCTATVAVLVPALSITTATNGSTTAPGSTVAYTVTLSNTGQTAYTATTVTTALGAVLDDATYNADAAATAGSAVFNAGASTLVWTGNLAVGATVTITASVTVRTPDPGDGSLSTTTTSTAAGSNCPTGGSSPACVTHVDVLIPELTITKSANVTTTTPGSVVRYTVSVTNTGQSAYVAATFSDGLGGLLDDGAYNNDAATTAGAVSFSSPTLTWTGNLLIGATATINYSVTVNQPDTGNRTLSAAVTSTTPGNTCPVAGNAPACASIVAVLIPGFTVTGSVETTTTPGSIVHYSVTLVNTGQTAYTGLAVTLDVVAVVDDATYNYDATVTTGALFTNPDGTVAWVLNLAPGATATGAISLTVNNPDTGDRSLRFTVVSDAPGSPCPTGSVSSACRSTATVLVPGLTLTKTANTSTVTPGGTVGYTISVVNNGQTTYPAASFTDNLAAVLTDATYSGGATATTGTLSYSASVLSWTGSLAPGASATITYAVTVRDPDPGDKQLYNSVVSSAAGNNCPPSSTDARCSAAVSVLVPGLDIVTRANNPTTAPGVTVGYTITATNSGATAFVGASLSDSLSAVVDDATYNANAAASTGTASFSGSAVTWTGDLAVGAVATITFSVTVHAADGGDNLLTDAVTSSAPGNNCPSGSTDAKCSTTVAVARLILANGPVSPTTTPGSVVQFTATYTNTGQVPYVGISVSSVAPTFADDVLGNGDQTASSGTLVLTATGLIWTGSIPVGGIVLLSGSVTVMNPDTGDKSLTTTTESDAPGNNCPPGSTDSRCSVHITVLVPQLTIAKTASTTATIAGGSVGYTITVHNTGQTGYTAASVTDPMGGVLDDATYDDNASATIGTVSVTSPTLSWTGDLATGATATITYSVTVHTTETGDKTLTNSVSSSTVGSTCPPASGNASCVSTVVVLTPELTIQKTAGVASVTIGANTSGAAPVDLASAATYAVLPGAGVTNAGATVINGDLGSCPIASITGFPPGVVNGATHAGDPAACTGHADLTIAYDDAVSRAPTTTYLGPTELAGMTLTPGVYKSPTSFGINGTLTLDGQGDPNAVFILQAGSTLITGVNSQVGLVNGAQTCNVFEQVGSSATLGVGSTFVGTMLAYTSITVSAGAAVQGRLLAVNGATTLDNNVVTRPTCAPPTPPTVTYTVKVTNSGQTTYSSAAFADSLAGVLDDATYNAGSTAATAGTVSYASGVLSWSGALIPGSSATITYTVTVNDPATGDGVMSNTVTSVTTGSNCPSGAGDDRCTATVGITNSASLTFTKTADVAATTAGAVVHYTVTVVNFSHVPVSSANFTDPLAGILDDASYNGDATADGGAVVYTNSNLAWSGAVPARGIVTMTYSVTVHTPVTGDQILAGTLSSTSVPASDDCLVGSSDPRCTDTVTVAGLLIQQHYTETSTTPGSVVHLSATFTNTGQTPYEGIRVSSPSADTVDDAIPTGDQVATSGTLVLSATAITWDGDIPVGGVVTVTGTLTVKNPDPAPGNQLLTGTLVSAALGNNCPSGGTDTRCTAMLAVLLPGLTITKSANTTFVVPGGSVTYTIAVANSGQTPYVGATVTDTLEGTLDDGSYNADALATRGTVSYAGPLLTWTGDLAVGATATITYSVSADNPGAGDKTMVNAVASTTQGSTCPPASGNAACRNIVAVLTPALTITSAASSATSVPGATVTYTLTATNTGQVPYAAATVSMPLAGLLDDATYGGGTATSGTVGLSGQTLTWTGALGGAAPASATVTYTVTVNQPVTGDFRLVQTVTSGTPGSTCPAGGTDPGCTTMVPIATLRITNTTDVTTTKPTGVVHDLFTFTNTGQVPYDTATIVASFVGVADDATYNGDATATSGSLVIDAVVRHGIVWTGDIAVGATVTLDGSVTVRNPDPGDKILSTVVTSDAPANNCPTGGSDPRCMTRVVVLIPALTITKSADKTTVAPGQVVGYTITITNSGQTAYTAATVADSLSGVLNDSTYNADAAASRGAVSITNLVLTWTGDLAVGQSATVSYSVRVNNPDLGNRLMVNDVGSGELGSSCPPGVFNPGCQVFVTVLVPVLEIAVTADRTTTVPGAGVTYTVTITNAGESDYVGASVAAGLAGVLDDAGYSGGATATTGTVTFNSPSLTWTGDLAVGATVIVTYVVTVADPDVGNHLLATSVTSSAPGSSCVAAQCANTVTVLIPGLAVSTSANVATATPGDHVVFTITVVNTGQTPYPDAVVNTALTGILDDAAFDGQIDASIGVASYTAPNLSWTGTLHVGDTATISYAVTVRNPDSGDKVMSATVSAVAPGSTCPGSGGNTACTATVTVLIPSLNISKSVGAATTTPGGVVGYMVIITNNGQTAYAGAVVDDSLQGVLPDADYNGDAAVGTGVLTLAASNLTWTGDLPIGASATITYSITVHDPDTGDKFITNSVTSAAPGSTCPLGGALAQCSTQLQVLIPGLVITKTADTASVVAGSVVHYTVTLVNTGQTAYAPATFTDPLAGVLDDAGYGGNAVASTGTLGYANSTLVWSGALDVGATATITYSVATYFPATGDHTLTNTVLSDTPGADCKTGADPRCTATVTVLVPALVVTKTAAASQVVAGASVGYTVTATNTGQADYTSATLTDSLAGVLDDASYNADATASRGSVSYAGGTISWTGYLALGASVTISYSVKANIVDTGDAVLTNRVVAAAVGSTCAAASIDPRCVASTTVAARTITVTSLTPSFTLAGVPHSTVASTGSVTMTVITNSPSGYQVSVQPETAWLTGSGPGNTATIPVDQLSVRETGTPGFRPLSALTPLVVHQQSAASAPLGDAVSNDYQIQIPFVPTDTYSTTLDYIVSAQ